MKGIISYLPTRYPTTEEIETCQWVELMGDREWNPHSESFAKMRGSSCSRKLVSPETLAKKWNIGIDTAKRTLESTMQLAICQAIHPIQRRYRTEVMQLHYPCLGGRHGCFYTDTFFTKTPTLRGCQMAQISTNNISFTKVFPMKHKSKASNMQDVGIPSCLHTDDAKELEQGKMAEITRKGWIQTMQSKPY